MALISLALIGIALWALVRLGRQSEGPRRGHWRIAATILGAVLLGGSVLAAVRGAFLATCGMSAAGLYLIFSSRIRPPTAVAAPPASGRLSEAEARSILGVGASASEPEIQAAWRRVMARAHPDQGGTEGLAARVNAARDRLLKP